MGTLGSAVSGIPAAQAADGQQESTGSLIANAALAFSDGVTKQGNSGVSIKAARANLITAQKRVADAETVVNEEFAMASNIIARQHSLIDSLYNLLERWKAENPVPLPLVPVLGGVTNPQAKPVTLGI